MQLYSLAGAAPTPILFDDMVDATGKLWKDVRNDPDALEALGYTAAPAAPAFDSTSQSLGWADGDWVVAALPGPTLDALKAAAIAQAQAQFANRITNGMAYEGEIVEIDGDSRSDLQAVVLAAGLAAQGQATWTAQDGSQLPNFANYARGWIALSGDRIPLNTPQDGMNLALAASAYYSALAQHEQDLENEIKAAADAAAVAAIDVTAGWPANG